MEILAERRGRKVYYCAFFPVLSMHSNNIFSLLVTFSFSRSFFCFNSERWVHSIDSSIFEFAQLQLDHNWSTITIRKKPMNLLPNQSPVASKSISCDNDDTITVEVRQFRQKAIDNIFYRTTVDQWKPTSLNELCSILKRFVSGKHRTEQLQCYYCEGEWKNILKSRFVHQITSTNLVLRAWTSFQ